MLKFSGVKVSETLKCLDCDIVEKHLKNYHKYLISQGNNVIKYPQG